ncbi:hypothetical protein DICPUDRAFT_50758 [Dictyostelium purpureum]|uniref:GH18 domain-containing protein n=1 Tax=Dictyostelium purpureum TaxID=5786 RepID=F1A073_DICPU|nr:uncharacterized protein DICPUDRAFT_50758 [Dictyostelium purpureum]EGC30398.1 hypothetical protein DICPUDRAFT_50758 [Dictyostelium purpureum]|eukprot:XP_003293066.1 hypothetical protein DICPUDRAFT_50758 [Dictyostelium purpureum]
MTQVVPFCDVSINAEWSDWQHYPNGRPNPIYGEEVIKYGATGLMFGFITLASNGEACWAAQPTMALDWAVPLANELIKGGKRVGVSFGGAANSDISSKFTIEELEQTYNKVIELYSATFLDFDLENGLYNETNICTALKTVSAKNPNVTISFTLPVLPSGLTTTGMGVVNKAKENNLTFTVNGMAMDYYDPSYKDKMGDAAIEAATSIKNQLKQVYPSESDSALFRRVAITPMIGLNDDLSLFTIDDASKVANFCATNSLSFLSHWDLNRDNPSSFSYVDLQTSSNPDQKSSGDYTVAMVKC